MQMPATDKLNELRRAERICAILRDRVASGEMRRLGGTFIATAIVTASVVALMNLQGAAHRWTWLLIAAVWVFGALAAAAAQKEARADLGLVAPRWGRDLRALLLCAAIVFPLLFLGVWFSTRIGLALPLLPVSSERRWAPWILYQVAYVAAPEELFFRGYVQGSLRLCLKSLAPERSRLWDPLALTAAAVLFAGAHVAVFHSAAQAWVFFPALVFGWLRARTGGVGAGVVFHALCNIFSEALGRGYGIY
jgi:membrane protease YdiL (CAAX protease family)